MEKFVIQGGPPLSGEIVAAGVNRDEVRQGAEELGVDFDEHVAFVIAAMEGESEALGLAPREEPRGG